MGRFGRSGRRRPAVSLFTLCLRGPISGYSTVRLMARFRGLSALQVRRKLCASWGSVVGAQRPAGARVDLAVLPGVGVVVQLRALRMDNCTRAADLRGLSHPGELPNEIPVADTGAVTGGFSSRVACGESCALLVSELEVKAECPFFTKSLSLRVSSGSSWLRFRFVELRLGFVWLRARPFVFNNILASFARFKVT